jgi:hypothetical protein
MTRRAFRSPQVFDRLFDSSARAQQYREDQATDFIQKNVICATEGTATILQGVTDCVDLRLPRLQILGQKENGVAPLAHAHSDFDQFDDLSMH